MYIHPNPRCQNLSEYQSKRNPMDNMTSTKSYPISCDNDVGKRYKVKRSSKRRNEGRHASRISATAAHACRFRIQASRRMRVRAVHLFCSASSPPHFHLPRDPDHPKIITGVMPGQSEDTTNKQATVFVPQCCCWPQDGTRANKMSAHAPNKAMCQPRPVRHRFFLSSGVLYVRTYRLACLSTLAVLAPSTRTVLNILLSTSI